MQVPVQVAPLGFWQQIMPALVLFVIGLLGALGLVVRAYAMKLIAQLQVNKISSDNAADSAQAATTIAASNALALATHTSQSAAKLDTIITQTNGINEKLTQTVADQQKKIEDLTNGKA